MKKSLTGHRRRVLQALGEAPGPVSALDLYKVLSDDMNLATVYRALPVLEAEGLVEGFTVDCHLEGTTRYFLTRNEEHRHFFHCTHCHRFFPLDTCGLAPVIEGFQQRSGHRVEAHSLSLTGTCRDCLSS